MSSPRKVSLLYWIFIPTMLGVLFFVFCQWFVTGTGEGRLYSVADEIPARKIGLVLGTSSKLSDGRSNLFFHHRIKAAAELYKAGKVELLLLSGEDNHNGYNEPGEMKEALLKAGVPESAMLLDGEGHRTLDSIIRTRKIFGHNEITVISQRFHNQRALFIADYYGIDAIGFNALDVERFSSLKTNLRELLARVRVVLDLHVLHTVPRFATETSAP